MPMQTKILTVRIITNGPRPLGITETERGLLEEQFDIAVRGTVDMRTNSADHILKAVIVETETE